MKEGGPEDGKNKENYSPAFKAKVAVEAIKRRRQWQA